MSKQFITEAQRMQKLANMPISEMALPEMARTAGTGGAYTITEKGEEILKQAKASGKAPEGIKNSELAALVFLFKAKKDGKRVQKIDYAKEKNVPQPAVNPIFNSLEVKELVSKEGYTSKQQEPKTSRPRPDVDAMLGDLDIEESKKTLNENQPAIYNDIEQDLMNGGFESIEDQIDYLQDIIKFCQEKIKEISGGLNENIDKDKLKKYYEYLLNLGGGDLGGDYGDMLNKAKDFSSVEEFIEDDINILATDDKKQAIEIRKWVEQNIKESKKELSEVILKIYRYDPSSLDLEDIDVEYFGSEEEAKKAALAHHWQVAFDNEDTDLSKEDFISQTNFDDFEPYNNYDYKIVSDKGNLR
jgi:hypothetical protein